MADGLRTVTGQCLCGAVRYEVHGRLGDAHACHCSQCRRQGGNFAVATSAKRRDFTLVKDRSLKWFQSSKNAQRGFCGTCGSALFWDDGSEEVSINAGSLDEPTGVKITSHIYVADKGDFYDIDDDLPKFADHETPVSA